MIHVGDIIKVDVYSLEVIPLPEDFLSDVQTDVHFVPIDSLKAGNITY